MKQKISQAVSNGDAAMPLQPLQDMWMGLRNTISAPFSARNL